MVAAIADREIGSVNGPGVVAVGSAAGSGWRGEFGEEGVGAVVGVLVAALEDEGSLARTDVAVSGGVEDVPAVWGEKGLVHWVGARGMRERKRKSKNN